MYIRFDLNIFKNLYSLSLNRVLTFLKHGRFKISIFVTIVLAFKMFFNRLFISYYFFRYLYENQLWKQMIYKIIAYSYDTKPMKKPIQMFITKIKSSTCLHLRNSEVTLELN